MIFVLLFTIQFGCLLAIRFHIFLDHIRVLPAVVRFQLIKYGFYFQYILLAIIALIYILTNCMHHLIYYKSDQIIAVHSFDE